MWGAIIPAAASLVGGLLARESAEDQAAANINYQREFAQHGLQWKVADAKAAGVHPVYALGGMGASYTPSPIIVDPMANAIAQMGQSLGRLWQGDSPERTAQRSTITRAEDGSNYGVGGYITPGEEMEWGWAFPPVSRDMFQYDPPRIPTPSSSDPASTAGPHQAGYTPYNIGGMPMDFPSKNLSEPLESFGESAIAAGMTIQRNIDKYGEQWGWDFAEKIFGLKQGIGYARAFRDRLQELAEKAGASAADAREWVEALAEKARDYGPRGFSRDTDRRRAEEFAGRYGVKLRPGDVVNVPSRGFNRYTYR